MKTEPNAPINPTIWDNKMMPLFERDNDGLTIRQHFAYGAMVSYYGGEFIGQSGLPFETIAENCVKMADALIAELNKQ